MLRVGRLGEAELLLDQQRADAVVDEVAINLGAEVGARVLEPFEDLEAMGIRQGLQPLFVIRLHIVLLQCNDNISRAAAARGFEGVP